MIALADLLLDIRALSAQSYSGFPHYSLRSSHDFLRGILGPRGHR